MLIDLAPSTLEVLDVCQDQLVRTGRTFCLVSILKKSAFWKQRGKKGMSAHWIRYYVKIQVMCFAWHGVAIAIGLRWSHILYQLEFVFLSLVTPLKAYRKLDKLSEAYKIELRFEGCFNQLQNTSEARFLSFDSYFRPPDTCPTLYVRHIHG